MRAPEKFHGCNCIDLISWLRDNKVQEIRSLPLAIRLSATIWYFLLKTRSKINFTGFSERRAEAHSVWPTKQQNTRDNNRWPTCEIGRMITGGSWPSLWRRSCDKILEIKLRRVEVFNQAFQENYIQVLTLYYSNRLNIQPNKKQPTLIRWFWKPR